jgi:tetratricopeptide (TPR) repeat protein
MKTMRWRLALLIGIGLGLGVATWVERDRVAGIVSGLTRMLASEDTPTQVAELPNGEVPNAGKAPEIDPHGAMAIPAGTEKLLPSSLDGLFQALREADTAEDAQRIEVALFSKLGSSQSPSVNVLMQAGAQADALEDYRRARQVYADVLQIDPGFAEGWARAAASAYQMGDAGSALRDLKQAVAIEPRHFAAWAGLATVYEEAGYVREANDAWREALYWNPMMDPARRGEARTSAQLEGTRL